MGYGVPVLMSDTFFDLLDTSNSCSCRKINQLVLLRQEDEHLTDPHELLYIGEKMSIYTFDMDIEALWRPTLADSNSLLMRSTSDLFQHSKRRRPTGLVRRVTRSTRELVPNAAWSGANSSHHSLDMSNSR